MLVATAPGLRDQRVRVYAPVNTFVDGYQSTRYSFVGEYWSRVDAVTSRENAAGDPQQHLDFRTEAVATFDSYARVPSNGLARCGALLYFIRGIVFSRQLNAQTVALELLSTDRFKDFVLEETPTAPVDDRTPTVDPIPLGAGYASETVAPVDTYPYGEGNMYGAGLMYGASV